jgi:hypothetical protein
MKKLIAGTLGIVLLAAAGLGVYTMSAEGDDPPPNPWDFPANAPGPTPPPWASCSHTSISFPPNPDGQPGLLTGSPIIETGPCEGQPPTPPATPRSAEDRQACLDALPPELDPQLCD